MRRWQLVKVAAALVRWLGGMIVAAAAVIAIAGGLVLLCPTIAPQVFSDARTTDASIAVEVDREVFNAASFVVASWPDQKVSVDIVPAMTALWRRRPPLEAATAAPTRAAGPNSPRNVTLANFRQTVFSPDSQFGDARRGAVDVFFLLVAAMGTLLLCAAVLAACQAAFLFRRAPKWWVGLLPLSVGIVVIGYPLLYAARPDVFQGSLATTLAWTAQVSLVAVFAGLGSRVGARALWVRPASVDFLARVANRPMLWESARRACLDAAAGLAPAIPSMVMMAVFLRGAAALRGDKDGVREGLGALIASVTAAPILEYRFDSMVWLLGVLAWLLAAGQLLSREVVRAFSPIHERSRGTT